MVAKPKRAPLPTKIIQKRCRKKATRSKVKAKDTKVHDDHDREEVLALLQAWKDDVPVSDINRREIRLRLPPTSPLPLLSLLHLLLHHCECFLERVTGGELVNLKIEAAVTESELS